MFRGSRLRPHIARMVYIDGPGPSTGIAYQLRFALGMANEYTSFVSETSISIIEKKYAVTDAVTKSDLLAQNTANDQNKDATDHEGWYRSYEKALAGVGWVIDAFSFRKVIIDKEMVTVASMLKQVMGSMRGVSADLFSGFNSTITALNEKEENSTLLDNLLSNCAKEGRHHSVQVILGYQDSEDSVTMILGLFYFNLDKYITNWLLTEVKSSEIEMFVCVQKAVLNLAIWDQVKDAVTEKLSQHAIKVVLDMPHT